MTWSRLRTRIARLAHTPWLLVLQKLLRRVPFRPFDIGKMCFLRLDGRPNVPASMLRGSAEVRFATAADLPRLVELRDKQAIFVERFAEGDRCVVAIAEGHIIGYEWFSDRPIHYESSWGYSIRIPGGFVYAYDAFIDPDHRNTGLWLRFKAYLSDWMMECDKRGVLTFVDYGNWASMRTHLRFGFEPSGNILAFRMIGLRMFHPVR
jgi:GNAT superfamily N-acetyltransferase